MTVASCKERNSPFINQAPYGLLGVSMPMNDGDMDYYIAAPTDKPIIENTNEYFIPDCKWAIFDCMGTMTNPLALQDLQQRIFTEWLPSSAYEYANAPQATTLL